MKRVEPFERHTERYDDWFERHPAAYETEVDALRPLVDDGVGLEVGVGTGRFAVPLDVRHGVDPSRRMLEVARERGIVVTQGVAESLPYRDGVFDVVLVVTTICFVDDVSETLSEAARVLGEDGAAVLGYVDSESQLGRRYREEKEDNPFYSDASFLSTDDVLRELEDAGFTSCDVVQTLFDPPEDLTEPQETRPGHGEGSFVGVRARL
ncbi:MAG: class I SAM-dependent methyltransferase [Halobacteriales archaeon]